jgi:hypothetical protein
MARATTKISLFRGDSYPLSFTLRNAASATPIDLTDCSLLLTVDTLADPPDDTTQVFQLTGSLDADPTTGKVYFTPDTTDTATVGTYYYDVQLTDADSNIRTVVKSTLTISMDITK